MKYKATITASGNQELIFKAFSVEKQKTERSQLKITKIKEGVLFEITADDAVALRATINGITRLLTVAEKLIK